MLINDTKHCDCSMQSHDPSGVVEVDEDMFEKIGEADG